MQFLLYAFLAYILYQFIFKLVIPVYLATRRVKKGFREMQNRMQEQMRQQQGYTPNTAAAPNSKPPSTPKKGDYIDFEEL